MNGAASFFLPFFLAVAAMYVFVAVASAQGGPPMITDDTETVPKHHFEINSAFTVERGTEGTLYAVPLVDFNYGLSRNTQLKVEMPWLIVHDQGQLPINGLGNANFGVRWRFRDEDEKHRVAMSIYPQVEFNVFQSSVRRGIVDKGPEFLLPLQWQTQVGKWGINGDLGYRFKRGQDETIYGVVVGRELNRRIEVLGEVHGEGPTNRIADHAEVYNFGTRVGITSHTTFLFSAGSSLRRHFDPKFIAYTGLQITF